MTKLLLAGATGLVGGEAPALSLADERVTQVVAPTRRQLAPHPKLFNPIVETGNLQLAADWWAVDGGLCAIGTTRAKTPSTAAYRAIGFDYALAIARRIREGGAPRFALTPPWAQTRDRNSCTHGPRAIWRRPSHASAFPPLPLYVPVSSAENGENIARWSILSAAFCASPLPYCRPWRGSAPQG